MMTATPLAPQVELLAEWRLGVRWLLDAPPPNDFEAQWQAIRWASAHFMREHAAEAAALGWTTVELWGVHPVAPAVRIDAMGALMFGDRVAKVLASELVYADGLVYRRSATAADPPVPVWEHFKTAGSSP
jgi:hypothetical protein